MAPTPEQRRKNKRTGLIFLVIVIVMFAWMVGKQVYITYF
jgi:flagellar basal body-associated protein FliL